MSSETPLSTMELGCERADPTLIVDELLRVAGFSDSRIRSYCSLEGGNPVMSQVFRVWISGVERGLSTAIVKMPARQSVDRFREAANGSYVREIEIYESLSDLQGGFQPHVYASIVDGKDQTVSLLLEDLGGLPSRDEFDLSKVGVVLKNLAGIHSRYWCDGELGGRWWIRDGRRADIFDEDPDLFARNWEMLVSSPQLHPCNEPEVNVVAEFLLDSLLEVLNELDERRPTLSHGDLHTANMMFRSVNGVRYPVLIDWQDAVFSGGSSDVAKFLSTTLSPQVARVHFNDLISLYYSELFSDIKSGYSFRTFRREMMLALLGTFANYVMCATTQLPPDVEVSLINGSLRSVSSVIAAVKPLEWIRSDG